MNPESHITALLWLPLLGVGTVCAVAVGAVVWRYCGRILPRRRSRPVYWAGVAVLTPLALAGFRAAFWAGQAVGVIGFAGWDAYAGGLRLVNNKGLLSDGRYLSGFWDATCGAVSWTVLLVVVSVVAGWHLHFHPPRAESGSPVAPDAEPGAAADGGGR
jgi:hypothetical protein